MRYLGTLFLLFLTGCQPSVYAHDLKQSESMIIVSQHHIKWTILAHAGDVERFEKTLPPGAFKSYLSKRVGAIADGEPCAPTAVNLLPPAEAGHSQIDIELNCPRPAQQLTLFYNAFFGDSAHHNNATVRYFGKTLDHRFTPIQSTWDVPGSRRSIPWGFIIGGMAILGVLSLLGWWRRKA